MFVKEVYFDSRPFFSADHLNRRESKGVVKPGAGILPAKTKLMNSF